MESESCDQRLEDCAMATINSTSSLLYISDSLVKQKDGRVGYFEMINGLRGEIRFDAQWNPVNWDCVPLTETTEMFHSTQQTIASTDSHTGSSSKSAWEYQCQINQDITDILWILQFSDVTETLSRCYIGSERCDQRLEDCAMATINSTSSLLYISDSLVRQKNGQVGYAEIINGLKGEIRFDAERNPVNWDCVPLTETTEMFKSTQKSIASADSTTGTNLLAAWQYRNEINENVTDVLWILDFSNETETLSRCYIGSESCDQRLEECAMATINSSSSLLYISDSFVKQKVGRVGYAEIINDLKGEIRFDARRNPINWACVPITETTEMFP
ncbi:uncharacterized protein LOC112568160 isoform X2 [Pomacea canaliculata]|uniref:uncharacterized protein LOC112568160 isoform X2 n=1 Tax=Pomacea canaliculata TaxID=400727 RepID=UPI000D72CE1A|nr:uncharacterized protein LOC112568160 isoform X2 [Pomacea canaliculata]